MINDIAHARSFARDLKRILKPHGVGHLAAHDVAGRILGRRDWRDLATVGTVSASREQIAEGIRKELGAIAGVDVETASLTLLPAETVTKTPREEFEEITRWRDPELDDPKDPTHAFTGSELAALLRAVTKPVPEPVRDLVTTIDKRIAEGWFFRSAVHDILVDSDRRLDDYELGMHLDVLIESLGYRWENTATRPKSGARSAIMLPAMRVPDFAALAIDLEALGFVTPTRHLVERLRPAILRSKVVTTSELRVLWHAKEAGSLRTTYIAEDVGRATTHDTGRLANGYRYEATRNGERLRSLVVIGSRWRLPRSRTL